VLALVVSESRRIRKSFSEAARGATGSPVLRDGPEVGLGEMWNYGVLFALQCPRTPFLGTFRVADDSQVNDVVSYTS
jgi:hypothetical protein